jgi:DNA-binding NarL/FixJ family response regulator
MPIRILIADDHQIVRQGIRALLNAAPEFEIVGEAADGVEALRLVGLLRPQVLLLDLTMPGLDGLEVARQAALHAPGTRVVVLSMHSTPNCVVDALRAGAAGYVLKDSSAEHLADAIRSVHLGCRYLSPAIDANEVGALLRKERPPDPCASLTCREREVLQLTAAGHTSLEISERLFISPRTVESHRANLMRKLKIRNQRELVRFATEHGLAPPMMPR